MQLPQEALNVQADHMGFKELQMFAQKSKASLARVKSYFDYKEALLRDIKCPVLTRDKVIEIATKNFPRGLSSFIPSVRSKDSDTKKIVEIEGVAWHIPGSIKEVGNIDDLPSDFFGRKSITELKSGKDRNNYNFTSDNYVFKNIVLMCNYDKNSKLKFVLMLNLERPTFSGDAPAPVK